MQSTSLLHVGTTSSIFNLGPNFTDSNSYKLYKMLPTLLPSQESPIPTLGLDEPTIIKHAY